MVKVPIHNYLDRSRVLNPGEVQQIDASGYAVYVVGHLGDDGFAIQALQLGEGEALKKELSSLAANPAQRMNDGDVNFAFKRFDSIDEAYHRACDIHHEAQRTDNEHPRNGATRCHKSNCGYNPYKDKIQPSPSREVQAFPTPNKSRA